MTDAVESMFTVREAAWHGLGIILQDPPTIEEAITAAGLDWEVELQQAFIEREGKRVEIPGRATVRSTDGSILGVVGPGYRPIQNREAFDFFQPFLDQKQATLETAGSLFDGQKVWVLAKACADPIEVVKDDPIEQYILLSNAHDGTRAVRAGFTATRVVCNNTLNLAHSSDASRLLKVRHTQSAPAALEKVREIMDVARGEFVATTEQLRHLAEVGVTEETLRKYVRRVFRTRAEAREEAGQAAAVFTPGDDFWARVETQQSPGVALDAAGEGFEAKMLGEKKRIESQVMRLHEEGAGTDVPGVKGTLWGAYNAVTEFITHERGRSEESRLDSQWFGAGAKLGRRALDVAVQMAA